MRRLALAVLVILLLAGRAAEAGDRRLAVLLVNMTPDGRSSAASKACVKALRGTIAADYTAIQTMGETALRKQVGKSAGEPLLDWPVAAFAAIDRDKVDAIILVDCRPEAGQLDVVVLPVTRGLARIQVRQPAIDARWVGAAVLRRAWVGFSP